MTALLDTVAREAAESEREACAKACGAEFLYEHTGTEGDYAYQCGVKDCVAAIRARGAGKVGG